MTVQRDARGIIVGLPVLLAGFGPKEFPVGGIFSGADVHHRGHDVVLPVVVLILAQRIVLKGGAQRHVVALIYTLGLGLPEQFLLVNAGRRLHVVILLGRVATLEVPGRRHTADLAIRDQLHRRRGLALPFPDCRLLLPGDLMGAIRPPLVGDGLAGTGLGLARGLAERRDEVVASSLLQRAAALAPVPPLALAHQVTVRLQVAGVVIVAGQGVALQVGAVDIGVVVVELVGGLPSRLDRLAIQSAVGNIEDELLLGLMEQGVKTTQGYLYKY